MTTPGKMTYEEQKRRGEAIYEAEIRQQIGPEDENKFVLIDVLTGDYEIDERSAPARIRLWERRPDAVIHTMINHRTRVIKALSPRILKHRARAAQ